MATPSPGWVVGNAVRLRTTLNDEISGVIFAFEQHSGMLMLKEKGSHNGVANIRLLNVACVAETISDQPAEGPVDSELPVVDLERGRKREEKALKQAEADYDRVGVGVSKEAQAIFEALHKTLPCKWRKKTIIVLDEVLVPEPYTVSSCTTEGRVLTNPKALDRVRLIVRDARAKLGLAEEE